MLQYLLDSFKEASLMLGQMFSGVPGVPGVFPSLLVFLSSVDLSIVSE